jgi:radical SAM protein with 4Fe4S-binding SPASM domain
MAIAQEFLGSGWYWVEASGDAERIWSSNIAHLNPANCDSFDLHFFTPYQEFTGSLQQISVFVDGRAQYSGQFACGYHKIKIECRGAQSVRLEADGFCPAQYTASADRRVLGISLRNIEVTPDGVVAPKNGSAARHFDTEINLHPDMSPIMMQVEISTACHLECVMCSRTGKTGGPSQHMKSEIWDKFFDTARRAQSVNFLGLGEPWTHRSFLDFLRQLDDAGVIISIITTGDLIDADRAYFLGQLRNLRDLNFSIDSPDPEIYFNIRGQPLSRALRGLERSVRAIGDPHVVRINATVMRDNLASMAGFPKLLREYSVKRFVMRGVVNWNVATHNMVPDYTDDERAIILRTKNEAEDAGASVNLLPTLPADLIEAPDFTHEQRTGTKGGTSAFHPEAPVSKVCMDPWERAIVTRDGDVYPCECYGLQKSVGSLARQSFDEIWRGEGYARVRRDILSNRNVGCRSCDRRGWGVHPLNLFAAEIVSTTIKPGGDCEMRVRNRGKTAWTDQYKIHLGAARPRDRLNSIYADPSWIAPNRVAGHAESVVLPGEIGTFPFQVARPGQSPGQEYFQLVAENQCWLPGTEIRISGHDPIRVESVKNDLYA